MTAVDCLECTWADWYKNIVPAVRVVIADDHPLYLSSLVRAIEETAGIEVVAQASDGRAALAEIRRHVPDVALVDARMPGLTGEDVLNAVVHDGLPTRVMLLSGALDDEEVYGVLESGAAAVLSKGVDVDTLLDSVAAVARGETVVAPELHGAVANQIRLRAPEPAALLSPREHEVLELIAEGLSVSDIAARIALSPATVKSHIEKAYAKLGVSDRAAAVATAIRRGVLQ